MSRVVVVLVAASMLVGATVALAATPGTYKGMTRDGGPVTIKVAKSGKSGTFKHCGESLKFTISSSKFSVKSEGVQATGKFSGDKVSGRVQPTSCSGRSSPYTIKRQ